MARELDLGEKINLIRIENPNSLQDQSHTLLKLWAEKEGNQATEASLIKTLTKINRMDIVHLIETRIIKSTPDDTTSHTYAEIERTIGQDHSEGFSALHEDIDSPRPGRRSEVHTDRSPGSGQNVPMVAAEDLSKSLSSLNESTGKTETDSKASALLRTAQKDKLQKETTFSSQAVYEEIPHTGTFKQADNLPDIPSQTVTEEKYTDEHGNMVVKKITRKVIHKYVSADGTETQEVTVEGSRQEIVQIEEGDAVSRVIKRTVLRSEGDQKELTFSEPPALGAATSSEFEVEPVQGRKVSKVVKTTVVRGERTEKQTGDRSLAADLPSAREDFEKKPNA